MKKIYAFGLLDEVPDSKIEKLYEIYNEGRHWLDKKWAKDIKYEIKKRKLKKILEN